MPKRQVRGLRKSKGKPLRKIGLRLMLVVLVLMAVLILLLRLAEYPSHGVRHPRRTMAPAAWVE